MGYFGLGKDLVWLVEGWGFDLIGLGFRGGF